MNDHNARSEEPKDSEPYICGMTRAQWNAACRRYVEKMAQLPPEQTRHALCDHAYGICLAPY